MSVRKKYVLPVAFGLLLGTTTLQAAEGPGPVKQAYHAGQRILVLWKNQWWLGEILQVRAIKHNYRVHYTGWPKKWDEWLSTDRLARNCELGVPQSSTSEVF